MEYILETERLYVRKLEATDAKDLFEMDSDPEVHRFVENKPVLSINEVYVAIDRINKQYIDNGIGRWAVIDKATHECVGWAGLKFYRERVNQHQNFYELGYRFKRKHWGKGLATESSKAIIAYGFQYLKADSIYAITHPNNQKSIHVLHKLGFTFIETFDYEGDLTNWFELNRSNWNSGNNPTF